MLGFSFQHPVDVEDPVIVFFSCLMGNAAPDVLLSSLRMYAHNSVIRSSPAALNYVSDLATALAVASGKHFLGRKMVEKQLFRTTQAVWGDR